MTAKLPRFICDLLGACPAAGAGVHNWLFRCARVLHAFYPNRVELANLLAAAAAGCGRHIPNVKSSRPWIIRLGAPGNPNNATASPNRSGHQSGPRPNQERIEAITKDGPGLVDLWEISPLDRGQ